MSFRTERSVVKNLFVRGPSFVGMTTVVRSTRFVIGYAEPTVSERSEAQCKCAPYHEFQKIQLINNE
ncbi:hypothetical protein [Kaistella pullorum]|uniref:Uncharacterized protein n=1 Tax=Kaistella pullorum TaxID=2763074 RepID=A0ABR8WJS9_9FLAO|nr:hypothetical protein [Kaistella pullorum]MBD8017006.1 hypothetical protein [Kaistella pullorum]